MQCRMKNITPQKLIAFAVLALLGVGAIGCVSFFADKCISIGGDKKGILEGTTVIWGMFDTGEQVDTMKGGHKIEYIQIPEEDFEERLVNAIAEGRGPDVVYIRNSWLPKLQSKLIPFQNTDLPAFAEYRNTFVDVAVQDFVRDGPGNTKLLYAVPLYVDTLALYWNRDIFNGVGITEPPVSWEEFSRMVPKLRLLSIEGKIIRAGAAIGAARNINRSSDIVSMLMLQAGTKMVADDRKSATFSSCAAVSGKPVCSARSALQFYTDFANDTSSVYTWSNAFDYSIDAFVNDKAAMMINYAHQLPLVKQRRPELNFRVAPIPQPQVRLDEKLPVTYANYMGLAVPLGAKNPKVSWQFILDATGLQSSEAYLHATGRPPARIDLIDAFAQDPDFSIFVRQALTASSWYQPDARKVDDIFADMIDSVVGGTQTSEQALGRAEAEVSILLKQLLVR